MALGVCDTQALGAREGAQDEGRKEGSIPAPAGIEAFDTSWDKSLSVG